jgi:hypothetical protein
MDTANDTFIVRTRFWPLWLALVLFGQLVWLLLTLPSFAVHVVLIGPLPLAGEIVGIGVGFGLGCVLLAGFCLGVAWLIRSATCVVLSPSGISLPNRRTPDNRHRLYSWPEVADARPHVRIFSRWLRGGTVDGTTFLLPLQVDDPDEYLDAVHRFAGSDHPLTVALRTQLKPNNGAA